MAPPIFGKRDADGKLVKQAFGTWMKPVLRVLANLKWLRGSVLDPFGHTRERRRERALIGRYRKSIEGLLLRLKEIDPATVLAFARVPEQIRGYGHVKAVSIETAEAQWQYLSSRLEQAQQRTQLY